MAPDNKEFNDEMPITQVGQGCLVEVERVLTIDVRHRPGIHIEILDVCLVKIGWKK